MKRSRGEPAKNAAASVKSRLLNRARREGEDFNSILTRYVLERLLHRLAVSDYSGEFVLKGALLFVVWSARPHRATKDLDLLGHGAPDAKRLVTVFQELCQVAVADDGVVFLPETVTAEAIREEAVYDGIRVRFVARLGSARVPVQVDVGFGDSTVPAPQVTEVPPLLDLPAPKVLAYARESVVSEKLHAMVDLGLANSRMKDYFDLWFLSQQFPFTGSVLVRAISSTFARRRVAVPQGVPVGLADTFAEDPAKLAQWRGFLRRSRLAMEAPSLGEVVPALRAFLIPPLQACAERTRFARTWSPRGPWW